MRRVYLDHSATTPLDPAVFEVMQSAFQQSFGNASSIHSFGRESRLVLEESRETIAKSIGAKYDEVFFTSGGTEADNHALKGVAFKAQKRNKNHIVISAVEHHAVLEAAEWLKEHGFGVSIVPVDKDGRVDPQDVEKAITSTTCLISVMHANNEVGTMEPVQEIGRIAKQHEILFHSDTVQTVGKVPVNVNDLGVDLLAMSAHKLYGPKGIGAIYIRRGTKIDSLIQGGSQESNRRAGTENVPLAAGFAKAVQIAADSMEELDGRFRGLRDKMKARLSAEFEGIVFNGHVQDSLPHIVSISFDSHKTKIDSEALIMGIDLRGVAVTSGSACASGSTEVSHVLRAMGRDEKTAKATIRFSMGKSTTEDDVNYAVDALHEVLDTMKGATLSNSDLLRKPVGGSRSFHQ